MSSAFEFYRIPAKMGGIAYVGGMVREVFKQRYGSKALLVNSDLNWLKGVRDTLMQVGKEGFNGDIEALEIIISIIESGDKILMELGT